jgi:UDPglucose 6-dehydrogenase
VETLIFGCALERALNPERFIVGLPAGDSPIPDELQAVLDSFDCPILPMRYESAELAKIAINTMLVASIQATDMLADVCELVGADWDEVVPSLRLDRRIGEFAYLAPSLGVGGSNLERDLVTLQAVASTAGIKLPLVATWREMSERRRDWSYRTIADSIAEIGFGTRIAILGLAYKPNTDSTRNSPGLLLLEQLQEAGASVVWHDPIVTSPADIEQLRTMSAREAAAGADVVVLTTAWDEYKELTGSVIKKLAPGALVVDPHGVLDRPTFVGAGSRYITMGSGLGT